MNSLNGVVLVDKPSGMTSHDVVEDLRRILKIQAVGHAGTLDPLATGLLVCLVGEATKLSQYVMNEEKSYRVGLRFGIRTDSGDITGKVMAECDAGSIEIPDLKIKIDQLVGEISLLVPKYSAVKVGGRKLYEYARKNEDVEVPKKIMTIHRAQLLEYSQGQALIDIDCEKGTYVRSWVEKLGENLGVGATVTSLRRLTSGAFKVEQSQTVSEISEKLNEGDGPLVPMEDVLGAWPALMVFNRDQTLLKNGQIPRGIFGQISQIDVKHGIRLLDDQGQLLALVVRDDEKGIKLARVFKN